MSASTSESNTMDADNVGPRRMSLIFLEEITNGFSNDQKVGAGSYGNVYKGELKNGETIAVKVLHYIPGLDDEQFEMEYLNLASLAHKNIVRLLGYCHETIREVLPFNGKMVFAEMTKRALCFDFMHNGSLDKYLSDEFNGHGWCTRYTIIKGICQGLKYLHEELKSPMYHLDLKPANVLLDENMVPKLADFGLSRLVGGEQTQRTTSAIGTHGYVPPEYIDAGIISNKFDVFSLGVVIIKIMTGPTGYYRIDEMSSQEFIEAVHAKWTKRLHAASVHLLDSYSEQVEICVHLLDSYSEQVKICIKIALSCVDADRHKRPTIGLISSKLNETDTVCKICRCISTECELMDVPLKKLVSHPLLVANQIGELLAIVSTTSEPQDDDTTAFELIRPKIMIVDSVDHLVLAYTVDVHPVEPWILVGHLTGYVTIWNYHTQEILMTFGIKTEQAWGGEIFAARFIAREQWFVAADATGQIHVYAYTTTKHMLKNFQAHAGTIDSLAVHPSDPFVLSSSADKLIKLWSWENGWECIRTFRGHTEILRSVKFNPLAASNTFASASVDGTVKIWSMYSDTPISTLECGRNSLRSVHYFVSHGSREYIVTGTYSGPARIWDLETNTCIRHINGLGDYSSVKVVDCLPGHQILVTRSEGIKVNDTQRDKEMVDFTLGRITDIGCIEDTLSDYMIEYAGVAIMEIN